MKGENKNKAIEMFEKVVELESQHGNEVKWYVFFYSFDVNLHFLIELS